MKEYKIHEENKFLAKNKKRFEKGAIDKDTLKVKKQTMTSITKDMTGMPEKLHIMGPLSKPSARSAKKDELPLEGEDKMITPEDETPQRKIED